MTHEKIGVKLHGQMNLPFKRIRRINKIGFSDTKLRRKSMHPRMFEANQKKEIYHKWSGDVLLAINWVQLLRLMVPSMVTHTQLFFATISFHISMPLPTTI